jgi:hypothetical protein
MKKWLDRYESGGLVSKNSLNRKVTCSNCGWSWKLSDGGEDPLTCHKCGGTIKMKHGGEHLDEYKTKGEVKQSFKDQLLQKNGPVIDKTAAPILLPSNLNYNKTRVVNGASAGLNKAQLKNVYQNLKYKAEQEKKQELEDYKVAKLFHENNPVAKVLGTRKPKPTFVEPTARELAYGLGAGISNFYDVPGIGIANDFVNPLSLVSKGIISPWAQAPLQAQQSDSYLPYLGAAASTALTIPMVRPASIAAKTFLNPRNIYTGALKTGEYLTTQTPLKNTYKILPEGVFKEYSKLKNSNKSYRVAGLDAAEDFKNTGVLRSVQQGVPEGASLTERAMSRPTGFPSFQKGYADMAYADPKGSVVFETELPTFKRGQINPVTGFPIKGRHYAHRVINPETGAIMTEIPAENIRVFGDKPHWLKGYPQIKVPNKKFKSEINWRNWNKEIPKNVPLMQEYNAIEQTTKANGTWMKNFDGSKFKGTPEQFVQQNSENFKKAFGKDFNTAYRGQRIPTNIMDGGNYPSGITFLGDKNQAMTYGETWKKSHSGKIYQPGMFDPKEPALYELIYPNSNNKKIITHSNVRDWRELTDDEVASQLKKVDLKRRGLSDKGEQFITTDDVAYFVKRNDLDYAYIPKIRDYGRKPDRRFFNLLPGKSVGNTVIVNSKPGNYLKSRWYNNGMFDMTNPNIYKVLVGAGLFGTGAASALQQKKHGGQFMFANGGEILPIFGPGGNKKTSATFNPYANVNRVGSSDNTKVYRVNPEQQKAAVNAQAIKNQKIVKENLQNQRSFIGPDNRTRDERNRSIASRKAYDDLMEKQKVMKQQPIYQTLQNTTAGSYNPDAAYNPVIGNTAETLGYTAAGALGSSVARPVYNFMGQVMNAPIQGVAGLTGNNIVNAAFATHGLKSIMDGSVTRPWQEAYKSGNPWDYANAVSENAMTALELAPLVGSTYKGIALEANKAYNNIATGNSIIPRAWKSPAVGLSQGASDAMFKGLFNSNKLTDAERALIVEYQYDSKPFTGRGILPVNQEKKEALNNIIKKYNLNVNNNSIFTRRFNPENESLGADFVNENLNLKNRPTSFSAGVGDIGYMFSVDRLVIPNRYAKNMGNNFLANEYEALSNNAINLVDPKVKNFASDIGKTNVRINKEREVIGTGLNFKRIGKVKNDIGGYDHVVKPTNANGNLIWEKPNAKQLVQEYNVEHELKNLNLFKNKDEFINAVKNAKEEEITKGIDNLISNRSRTTSKKDLLSLSMTYKSYPKYRNEKTIEDIYTTLNLGGKMDMPIILEYPNGERKVFSGNTRMDLSFQSGINPKALIIKVPIKKQEGGAIITDRGQWDYPGQTTIIPSNEITMEGVPYPVLGVDDTGYTQMMQPQMNYTFPGQYVTEYPMAQNGKEVKKNNIRQAYTDAYNNYNNRTFPAETLPIRQKAFRTVSPSSYLDFQNYNRWNRNEQRDVFYDPRSEEAWNFYLGLSKPEDLKYIKKSQYRPTIIAVDQNYYTLDPELEQDIFNTFKDEVSLNKILQTDEGKVNTRLSGKGGAGALGNFGVSKGHDEKGDYLAYYDRYDLKDFAQDESKGMPYSIYNRIYYPKKQYGGQNTDWEIIG